MMQLLATALDAALVSELAQHAFLSVGAVGVLHAKGARDLPGADLSGRARR